MPYDVQSPLASAAAAFGGFMDAKAKKQQQDIENQRNQSLDAQNAADLAARLGLERSTQDATNAYRAQTTADKQRQLDLDTAAGARADKAQGRLDDEQAGKDAAAQKVADFQAGGLHYPKNWFKMKPEEQIAYLQVRMSAAQKAGDSKTVASTEADMNRIVTQAAADKRQADLEKQRGTQNANAAQRLQITVDNKSNPQDKPLTPYQKIQIDHWNQEHLNPDGTLKTNTKDTSGLSSMGNLQYQKDVRDWMMQGQDPSTEPDPASAKYDKKAAGGSGNGSTPKAKPVMHNGKAYYLHSDGNYYLTP